MFKNVPIHRKLVLITLLSTALPLALAFTMLFGYVSSSLRVGMLRDLRAKAKIVAANSTAALSFDDPNGASDSLAGLQADMHISECVIYSKSGKVFAAFEGKRGSRAPTELPRGLGREGFDSKSIWVIEQISHSSRELDKSVSKNMPEYLGTLYLRADTREWDTILAQLSRMLLLLLVGVGALAYLFANRLQLLISQPILGLGLTMRKVSNEKRFDLRAEKFGNDEVGQLIDGFNEMLGEVEQRDDALRKSHEELEARVLDRTKELENEIQDRLRAEKALAAANADLEIAVDQARRLAEAAQTANRAKSEFLANMSHEIRTPMNGVIGMTDLLMETNLQPLQEDYARTIRSSADTLLSIINDILDFSKIEAGKMTIETVAFDFRTAVEDVAELFAAKAQEKGVELNCSIDSSLPARLHGDPVRIRQVLTNLLSNAVKFTEIGEVTISVRQVGETEDVSLLEIAVSDTGIGIPANRLESIFTSFTQADGSTTRRYGGTGLGLTISRQFAELMDGKLSLKSEVGAGSTFTLTLPMGKAITELSSEGSSNLSGLRVLVVDDNQTNSTILVAQLRAASCIVRTAANGADALLMLSDPRDPYDLVVTDMQMPDQDGVHVARAIRKELKLKKLPLILLSSVGGSTQVPAGDLKNFSSVLTKPVRQAHLLAAVTQAVQNGQSASVALSVEQSSSDKGPNLEGVRVLLAEDNIVNQKVARQILAKGGCTVDAVENGRAALEALDKNTYDIVLMDCQMPEMDGFEATLLIRSSNALYKDIPVIAVTANALNGDREQCLQAGMSDYITKPIRPAALFSVIRQWTGSSYSKEPKAA